MIADKIKELEKARQNLAELEAQIAKDRNAELGALPARYGFADAEAFIAAVAAAAGGAPKRRGRPPKASSGAAAPTAKRRKRAKITDETRAEVKKLTEAGKSGAEIAKAVGISLPSVQNIKKALGLVKKRKK